MSEVATSDGEERSAGGAAVDPERARAIFARLPHRPPMLFLDEILELDPAGIVTRTTLREDFILAREGGRVSPLVAVEIFAQAAAAYFAAHTADAASATMQGALLGARSFSASVDAFRVGDQLVARVRQAWGTAGLAQFDCTLYRDGELVAEGAINVAARLETP